MEIELEFTGRYWTTKQEDGRWKGGEEEGNELWGTKNELGELIGMKESKSVTWRDLEKELEGGK